MAAEVALDPAAFNCTYCKWGRHCDASNPAPRKQWRIAYRGEIVAELDICPKPMLTADSETMLQVYPHWQAGRLPMVGGFLDQPHAYMKAMELIDTVVAADREARVARKDH